LEQTIRVLSPDQKKSLGREAAKQQRNEVENALALLCIFAALLLCDMKVFPTDV
jgi:hypothetical protein